MKTIVLLTSALITSGLFASSVEERCDMLNHETEKTCVLGLCGSLETEIVKSCKEDGAYLISKQECHYEKFQELLKSYNTLNPSESIDCSGFDYKPSY